MTRRKVIEIFETERARRLRVDYFPLFNLVTLRRAVLVPSYAPLFYNNIKFYRVPADRSGTGCDQIVILTPKDIIGTRATKTGYVVIEGLTIREELIENGE